MITDPRIKIIKILAGIGIAACIVSIAFHIPTKNTIFGLISSIPFLGAIILGGFVLSDYYKDTRAVLSFIFMLFSTLLILGFIGAFPILLGSIIRKGS
jgi:hypothetical protein